MSSSDAGSRASSPAPARGAGGRRKSTRAKKEIQRLDPSSSKAKQRKTTSSDHSDDDDDPSADDASSAADDASSAGEDDDDEEFKAPKVPARKAGGRKPRASAGAAGKKAPAKGRKPRARKSSPVGEDEETAGTGKASAKDFKIEDDNGLFNAVKSPNTALQQTAEDWIESYKEDSGPAMAELVNFVLRCCGCNATIDEHQAEDENGVVENLKDVVDEFKQESNHAYPLISKSKGYKKFRSSLSQFLTKLVLLAADDSLLYTSSFFTHFTSWVHALSSSQIRALRHTATVIVLQLVGALSELHVAVEKEHAQAVRAKEAEEKKGRKDKARLKDMQRQVEERHERLEVVEGFTDEGYTSVFVNRYRDSDAVIRAECISALGSWMKIDPAYWIDGDYLRYIGWVLSDESKEARRESVKALFSLYQRTNYLGKLHHFTDRFKQQLVSMALGEHDLAVRVQAIHVVRQIDAQGLLTDQQRDEVAQLVFEREKRVRTAAAEFWKGVVEEEVDGRKADVEAQRKTAKGRKVGGRKGKEQAQAQDKMVQFKVLAELLVKYGKELDGPADADAVEDEEDDDLRRRKSQQDDEDALMLAPTDADADPTKTVPRGRVAFAIEALWDGVDALRDWEALLGFLLRDHSAGVEEGSPAAVAKGKKTPVKKGKGRGKGKKGEAEGEEDEEMEDAEEEDEDEQEEIPEKVKLTEEEETLMLEVLLAALTRVVEAASAEGKSKKDKDADEETLSELSRAVIDALPRLFSKHQTFPGRMVDVLAVPRLVDLELYKDARGTTAYESLWDDVTKQFLKHTSSAVLDQAALTLVHFLSATNLSATNASKLTELEETLVSALRAAAGAGERDIESTNLEDDEILALTACVARVEKLAKVKDLGKSLEETDGGKEVAALELLEGIANRGRLGYSSEGAMVEHALRVLNTHVVWSLQALVLETRQAGSADLPAVLAFKDRRQSLLDKLEDFAVGNDTNAVEGVKQVALAALLDLHTISRHLTSPGLDPDKLLSDLKLEASDELQARCAGYVEAEIERYADQLLDAAAEAQDDGAEESDAEEDDEAEQSGSETETEETAAIARSQSQSQRGRKGKGKKAAAKGKGKKGKAAKGKGKKGANVIEKRKKRTPAQIRADNAKQQAALVATLRFEQTLAPFVRAVHGGALDLRHAVVLLKHWGRLGAVFDEQAKLLLHDLRDEGNYSSGSEQVASIVVDALKGALEIYLDGPESSTEEPLVSLGRNLVGVVVVRGAHLAIVKSLPSADHLRLHLDALQYIVKKLAHYEETKRRDERNKAVGFYKALAHLLFGLDGRSALKVKTSLDAMLEENSVEVSATSKTWEPVRAYQRRLITAMSKDPSIQKAAREDRAKGGKAKKSKAKVDADADEEDQLEDDDEAAASPAPARTSTRPRRSAAATTSLKEASPEADEVDEEEEPAGVPASSSLRRTKRAAETQQTDEGAEADEDPSSPKKRQRRSPTQEQEDEDEEGVREPSPSLHAPPQPAADEEMEEAGDLGSTMTASQSLTPQKKRPRGGEEEQEEAGDLGTTQTQSHSHSMARKDAAVDQDDEVEEERPEFEREGSAESTMSLTDIKKKKKRTRR
ncbi:hypothetical protein JCM10207_001811 [Rhodosporidiobolus poonsookiae]